MNDLFANCGLGFRPPYAGKIRTLVPSDIPDAMAMLAAALGEQGCAMLSLAMGKPGSGRRQHEKKRSDN